MLGLAPLGLYGIGFRLSSMVSFLMQAFQSAITPMIYSRYQEDHAPAEIARIFRYFVFFALLLFVALSLFSLEILMVLTTPAFHSAYIFVPFLVADQFLSGMYVFAPGLEIAKKTKYLAGINICSAVFSILLSIVLIYLMGLLGAAIACSLKALTVFIIQMLFSQKFYSVPHNFRKLFSSFFACGLLVLLGFATNKIIPLPFAVFIKFLILCSCIPVMIIIGIIKKSEVIHYLKQLKRIMFGAAAI